MLEDSFFSEQRQQSKVKTEIVQKYFQAWADIISRRRERLAYIDLFAGPGLFEEDGRKSTPLVILETVLESEDLCKRVLLIFNDKNPEFIRSLQAAIKSVEGISKLKNEPIFYNIEIGEDFERQFEKIALIPSLLFIDPWGYKGLSIRLINSVTKDWGCDCIFFFNYNRVNPGLENDLVRERMNALFGEQRVNELQKKIEGLSPAAREKEIIQSLEAALKENAIGQRTRKFVTSFRFKNDDGSRTTHYLIFVTKDPTGYKIMKDIMAGESSSSSQGVASFQFDPQEARQPLLFETVRPLDELGEQLLRDFVGQTLTVGNLFARHHIDTPFTLKNYQAVLKQLEANGQIITNPPAIERQRRKGELTLGESVRITFPQKR